MKPVLARNIDSINEKIGNELVIKFDRVYSKSLFLGFQEILESNGYIKYIPEAGKDYLIESENNYCYEILNVEQENNDYKIYYNDNFYGFYYLSTILNNNCCVYLATSEEVDLWKQRQINKGYLIGVSNECSFVTKDKLYPIIGVSSDNEKFQYLDDNDELTSHVYGLDSVTRFATDSELEKLNDMTGNFIKRIYVFNGTYSFTLNKLYEIRKHNTIKDIYYIFDDKGTLYTFNNTIKNNNWWEYINRRH